MADRAPARDEYDALVDLLPWNGPGTSAYAIVKLTHTFDDAGLRRAPPVPIANDIRTAKDRRSYPRGTDYAPAKPGADVVVLGSAFPEPGPPAMSRQVSVRVGDLEKRLQVFGERVFVPGERARIEHVAALAEVPLTRDEAYGGGAPRTDAERRAPRVPRNLAAARHGAPGVYPRNPYGKGFWSPEHGDETIPLPRVEDPSDLLTLERIRQQPERPWSEAPLPWHLDWMGLDQFPRFALSAPVNAPPPPALAEAKRGLWPAEWLDPSLDAYFRDAALFQEASLGLVWREVTAGAPIELVGMHPERERLTLTLPDAPRVEIEVEGSREVVVPRLSNLVLIPHEQKVVTTWIAIRAPLPRTFVPGLHGHIPLSVRVDGDAPIDYPTPETLYSIRRRAEAAGKTRSRRDDAIELGSIHSGPPQRARDQVAHDDALAPHDVDLAAGRLLLREEDWVLHGPVRLAFDRFYGSSRSWRDGSLGLGWSHSLDQAIWFEDGWLLYQTEDGREIGIPVPGGGALGVGQQVHHPREGVTVRRVSGDAFDVHLADGRHARFVEVAASVTVGSPRARPQRVFGVDGAWLDLDYDAHGRLAALRWPGGDGVRFEHDLHGRLVRVSWPSRDGRDRALAGRYEHDASGQLVEFVDGSGQASSYRYHRDLLTREVLRDGLVRRFLYDDEGVRCVGELFGADEAARSVRFDGHDRTVRSGDANGHWCSVRVNAVSQVERVLDAFGSETTRSYDEHTGMLASQTTLDGETTYLYDAYFHLADVSAPDQGSVALEHDEHGHLVSWTDADGHARKWAWDHLGRLAAVIDRAGASVVYDFDDEGPLKAILTPGEARVGLDRDPQTQAIRRITSVAGAREARRDPLSRVALVVDELGARSAIHYDPSGRVAQVTLPEEVAIAYETDGEGRVTTVHEGPSTLTLERDPHGRIVAVLEGRGDGQAGPRLHRDAEGRVKMLESEALDFWELIRDAAGRVIEELGFAEGDKRHPLRDHNGRVKRESRGRARTTVKRDRAARPIEVEHSDETFQRYAWTPGGRLARAQNADRVVELKHDGLGRPALETRSDGHWVKTEYGAHGRDATQSSLGLVVRVERDVFGRAMRYVAYRGEQRLDLTFDRDALGREARRHLPGGLSLKWSRDGLGRATERSVMFGERALGALRFTWAGLDRLVRVEDPQRGARDHRYDARGRLIQVGGAVRVLDEVGNVFRSEARDDHRYAPGGRLLETYGIEYRYDEDGRRVEKESPDGTITRYRWGAMGRLAEVALSDTTRVSYDYDGLGRMIARRLEEKTEIPGLDEPVWEAKSETHFVWDGLELLHEIRDGRVTSWLWDEGRLFGKLDEDGAYAALLDVNGVPTELTDHEGNLVWRGSVDLFGFFQRESAPDVCPWRFPGHWEDPDTGLAHAWLRVYDPETGAYLSESPLGIAGGANLYGYLDDPMTESSPLGLGRGYAALRGALRSERLAAERLERIVTALDRDDGAAGPRQRFDADAASPRLPDPEAILFGPWARYRPSENLPPPTSSFTRLPDACGLAGDDRQEPPHG